MRSFRLCMIVLTILSLALLASCDPGTTPSDADTTVAPATEVPTEDVTDPPAKKGCKSTLGLGVAFTLTAMAAAVALKKSKED